MKQSRQQMILDAITDDTETKVNNNNFKELGVDALTLSIDLSYDRTNVSRDLNRLWKEGYLVKIEGRPTLYFDYFLVKKKFPNVYIPLFITKDAQVAELFNKNAEAAPADNDNQKFYEAIGSLQKEFNQAKAALVYPPNGIPLILSGDIGVGKMRFAYNLYEFGISNQVLEKDANFIVVNCNDYSTVRSLSVDLFGVENDTSLHHGLIDQSNHGVLYFDGIEQLSSQNKDVLVNLIDRQSYNRIRSTVSSPLRARLIFSTTKNIRDEQVISLTKYIPMHINLPNVDNRSELEKIHLINHQFNLEAQQISKTIKLPLSIFIIICDSKYQMNISDIRSVVKTIVSRAYLNQGLHFVNTIEIEVEHLPSFIIDNEQPIYHQSSIDTFFNEFTDDNLYFNKNGSSNLDNYLYQKANKNEDSLALAGPITNQAELSSTVKSIINDYRSISNSLQRLSFKNRIIELMNSIKILLTPSDQHNYIVNSERNLYLLARLCVYLNETKTYYKQSTSISEASKILYYSNLVNRNHVSIQDFDSMLSDAFSLMKSNYQQTTVAVVLLMDYRNDSRIYQQLLKDNYQILTIQPTQSFVKTLENLRSSLSEMNTDKGILIFTDIPRLKAIHKSLGNLAQNSTTVFPLSIPLLEEATTLIEQDYSIRDFKMWHNPSDNHISVAKTTNQLIDQLNKNILEPDLTFLDGNKASHVLHQCLSGILKDLHIGESNSLVVKFIVHSAFMIERVIKKDVFEFPNIKKFYQANNEAIKIIEKNFQYAQESFGIDIPPSEIAYVTQIFLE